MEQPKKHFLNPSQRDSLLFRHRLEKNKKISYRINAILLLDAGFSYKEVSHCLLLGEGTVRDYYRKYIEEGEDQFLSLHYSGKCTKLTKEQLDQVEKFAENTNPRCSSLVSAYIEKEFSIRYTASAVTSLLRRLKFTYKKPHLIPGKIDPILQKKFLEEIEHLEKTLRETDKILYMDGVHPQHNSKPAYGWFKKGGKSILKANTGRKRININGALDPDNLELIYSSDDTINAQSTIKLFKAIENKYPASKKIVIICDNARYYRSKIVKEYLEDSKIEIKFLPPYSPNLNLIERLWRFMNKQVRDNKYYEKFQEFQEAIFGFLEKISSYHAELKNLLNKKFHIYDF